MSPHRPNLPLRTEGKRLVRDPAQPGSGIRTLSASPVPRATSLSPWGSLCCHPQQAKLKPQSSTLVTGRWLAGSPCWAAAEEDGRAPCLDTQDHCCRTRDWSKGDREGGGENIQNFGCHMTNAGQMSHLMFPITLSILQMRLLRIGEVQGLVQGPRTRTWDQDLNPGLADFSAAE